MRRVFQVSCLLGALPVLTACGEESGALAGDAWASNIDAAALDVEDQALTEEATTGLQANAPEAAGFASASNVIRSVWAPGLCTDVPDYGRPPINGDRLQMYRCHSGANQQFFFLSNGAIRTLRGGLCFDVPDYGRPPRSGDRLQVYGCHGGLNQSFYLPGDGTIRSRWGNLCLDVPYFGRPAQSGDYVQLYPCHGGPNQQFRLN